MSFQGMRKSIDPIGWFLVAGSSELHSATPGPIVSMSFRSAIPWQVALQQSPPPLHQPESSVALIGWIFQQFAANGNLSGWRLSHAGVHSSSACRTCTGPWPLLHEGHQARGHRIPFHHAGDLPELIQIVRNNDRINLSDQLFLAGSELKGGGIFQTQRCIVIITCRGRIEVRQIHRLTGCPVSLEFSLDPPVPF